AFPKFRRSRTTRTLGWASCSRVRAPKVLSVDPSSTKTASHARPSPANAEASSSYRSATLRSSLCTGMTTEITPRGYPCGCGSVALVPQLPAVSDALAAVLERAAPLPAEAVVLERAAGRVLAEEVRAAVDLPPFPSSSMDGYAVRAADVPGVLRIVGKVAA